MATIQGQLNTPRDTTFKSTETTPRNIADVLAEELSGIAQVLDPAASDYDQLSNKPQVNGVTLTGNKTSKQLGIRQTIPLTSAQYAQLSSAEKMDVDKDYIITDENATAAPIDDTDVSRNKVWSSYKVDEELDAIDSKIDDELFVTPNTNETWTAVLNRLFALTSADRNWSRLVIKYTNTLSGTWTKTVDNTDNGELSFMRAHGGNTNITVYSVILKSSGSSTSTTQIVNGGTLTYTDTSSSVCTAVKISLKR